MKHYKLFALLAMALVLSIVAAQCGPAPEPQTIVETVVVKETVEVQVEKEVIKEVEKEVVVTKEVEVEKVVEVPAEDIELVYMTAGDVNMLALAQNLLAATFKEDVNPNVNLRTVHTGPGEAGSRLIFEKLTADKEAGKEVGDVDVAMVHQIFLTWAMEEGDLLLQYAPDLETFNYVTAADAKNALGANVDGYVMPMFHSQTAIAYNPDVVSDPPTSYEELVAWTEENPGMFGYNGIKGGMSGVSFTVGWLYWKTGKYDQYSAGSFDEAEVETWTSALEDMKAFNENVTITAGNVGTLDALNRGEIAMGPVWVDMFYTFIQQGNLDPNLKLSLIEPGMPGQPMYFIIPANAPHPDAAKQFVEYVTSPEIQGGVIIDQYNWYPGIDGSFVADAFDRLYQDIPPEILSERGRSFPLSDYFSAMLEAYERVVLGGG
jgi:putative spermidine/putrescine transport system substrate-binding protein